MLDFRIEGGRIYSGDAPPSPNGVPAPGAVTALGIRAGRLVLDPPEEEPARRVIDASGLAVCPGFIDIHAHSDYAALYAPTALSKVLAGYTTELNGNCGYGAFPLYGRMKQRREDEYGRYGLKIDWEEAEEYLDRCRARPMALNQGLLIGQGTLRGSMVGFDDVRVDRDQRRHMQRYVERAMRLGCFGMSTGLVYAPGSFADRHEIVALAEVVADHDGLYASHLRSESDGVVEALDEFLSVCEQTGCRAEYSHVKTAGRRNWHKLPAVRQRMNDARAADVEVFGDRYPYTASCTDLATILLPNDALAGGGEAIAERLNDPRQRAALKRRITQREQIDGDGADWFERVMIAGVAHSDYTEASGQTLAGWADHVGEADPLDAAFDLIVADNFDTQGIHFSMSEENLREILSWPDIMVGSDSCLRDCVGPDCHDHPHPRSFGTPARVLGQFCRELKLLDLSTAIHKMTGLCADVMRLTDRGRIRPGSWADLVIFDPRTIADRADYTHPAEPPTGIKWVFVNGEVVVSSNGEAHPTSATPGRLLRFSG